MTETKVLGQTLKELKLFTTIVIVSYKLT